MQGITLIANIYINVAFWGCHTNDTYAKCVNTNLWLTGGCSVAQRYLQTVISAVAPFFSLAHTASPVSERQNVDNSYHPFQTVGRHFSPLKCPLALSQSSQLLM